MKTALERTLGLGSTISVVTGSVIGSGIFLVATDISKQLPSPTVALSVWFVAGLFSLMGGLIFAELGSKFPRAGGQYVFMNEAFGPLFGFLFAWTHTLVLLPGTLAALAVGVATFSAALWPEVANHKPLFATALLVALTVLNLAGLKKASRFLDLLTAVRIFALLAIAFGAFFLFETGSVAPAEAPAAPWSWSNYGVALIAAFWAFEGWNGLAQVASEIKEPKRNIPLGTIFGILIPILLYALVSGAFMRVLSIPEIIASHSVGHDTATRMWGSIGGIWVTAMMVLSTMGCLNGTVITGSRVIYASACDRLFPSFLGFVDPKRRVPSTALLLQLILAVVLVWSGTYDQLFTYVICASFLFYGLCAIALLTIRKRSGDGSELRDPSGFKVPFFPWICWIYAAFIVLFVGNAFVEKPFESLLGFGIVLSGVPFYALARWRSSIRAT